jgi:hypothetical protein
MGIAQLLKKLESAGLLKNFGLKTFGSQAPRWAADVSVIIHSCLPQYLDLLDGFTGKNEASFRNFLAAVARDCLLLLQFAKVVYFVFDGRRLEAKVANAKRSATVADAVRQLQSALNADDKEHLRRRRVIVHSLASVVAPYVRLVLKYLQQLPEFHGRIHIHVAAVSAGLTETRLSPTGLDRGFLRGWLRRRGRG